MPSVSMTELSRNVSKVVAEVERTQQPALVTNHGRVVAVLLAVNQDEFEEYVITHAPRFALPSEEQILEELRLGHYRPWDEVMAEIRAEERSKRKRKAATAAKKPAMKSARAAKTARR